MLHLPTFWKDEKNASILLRNEGFLESQGDKIFDLVKGWPALAGVKNHSSSDGPAAKEDAPEAKISDENERIVLRDVERTFAGSAQREAMQNVLRQAIPRIGQDYHQGMGYAAGFLLLTIDSPTVLEFLVRLNTAYIPGYWRHEAVSFATDALAFEQLLIKYHPLVAQHLKQMYILPETYCQKWFVGLCLHVLPFESLFRFFNGFLETGVAFLFQFGLALVDHVKDALLQTKNAQQAYELLRLERGHGGKQMDIVERAKDWQERVAQMDLAQMRTNIYENVLRPRVEAARKFIDENQSDDSDDDSEGGEGAGEECQQCQEKMPEMYCQDCKLLLCEECHDEAKDGHKNSHKVVEDWHDIDDLTAALKKAKIT